jgi:hypothetical protein
MPRRADVYRLNADQCLIKAEIARSKETRAEFLEAADQSRQLAEDADAFDELRQTAQSSEPGIESD